MIKYAQGAIRFAVSFLAFAFSLAYIAHGMSYLTEQRIEPGEKPVSRFTVVFVPGGEDGAPFDSADFRDLAKHKGSYLMPKDQDRFDWHGLRAGYESYTVLERTATEQLIEVHRHTGDYDFWSRYRATSDKVVPVSLRILALAHGVYALPFAILLCWASWRLTGRIAQRFSKRSPDEM